MVTGDPEDGCGIIAEWFKKLVVVVFAFAEVVDGVAEVVAERRHVRRIGFSEVGDHLVGHQRLRYWPNDAASVS